VDESTRRELTCYAIAIATTGGLSLITLLGLYWCIPALRGRWLPIARLRPGTCTGWQVFAAFCLGLGLRFVVLSLLIQSGVFTLLIGPPPDPEGHAAEHLLYTPRCVNICSPITLAVTLGALCALMFRGSSIQRHPHGLTWSRWHRLTWARWPANLGFGLAAFLLTWPIIMGIQALAVSIDRPTFDPYDALARLDLRAWEWSLFAFQTIVAAPVLEEILFRGILQSWLRRATLAGHLTLPFVTLNVAAVYFAEHDTTNAKYIFHFGPLAFATLLAVGYGFWLYRLTRRFELSETEIQAWKPAPTEPGRDDERGRRWADANATLGIYGTAMLFAIVHSSNWPAPLPLFPMGLALGWLSRRTQSLVGPIVFHAMFNLTSFIALYGMAR
jgi:membrane protease YdiL (CAAX protease family)